MGPLSNKARAPAEVPDPSLKLLMGCDPANERTPGFTFLRRLTKVAMEALR